MFEGIDFDFLTKVEGRKNHAYIPKNSNGIIGKSGATIGTGADLGNRTKEQVRLLEISESLKQKLYPYCEKRLEEADKFLRNNPLSLSWEEVDELDRAVIKADISYTINLYNRDSGKCFSDLPNQVKTVIASLSWNLGPNLKKFPTTWELLTKQKYKELYAFLYFFPCKPGQEALLNRRRKEALLIKQLLK